jgi:hypothetical protein
VDERIRFRLTNDVMPPPEVWAGAHSIRIAGFYQGAGFRTDTNRTHRQKAEAQAVEEIAIKSPFLTPSYKARLIVLSVKDSPRKGQWLLNSRALSVTASCRFAFGRDSQTMGEPLNCWLEFCTLYLLDQINCISICIAGEAMEM